MEKRKSKFLIYFFTLMAVEFPVIWFARDLASGFLVLAILGGGIAHFFLFIIGAALLNGVINKKFENEYNPILEAYKEDNDARKLLDSLKNMNNKPRSLMMHNVYNFTISTAYYELGEKYAALTALNNINTADGRLAREVVKQREKVSQLPDE